MRDSPYFPADLAALQLDQAARAAGRATACPREHQEEKLTKPLILSTSLCLRSLER
jgi:hypothetical protein